MAVVKIDEESGWADFASFDSKKAGHSCTGREVALNPSNGNGLETVSNRDCEITSHLFLLKDIFECRDGDGTTNSIEDNPNCLEAGISVSKVWENCNAVDLEAISRLNFELSNWRTFFVERIKSLNEDEEPEVRTILPENLQVSPFVHCFDFHKFSQRGRQAKSAAISEIQRQRQIPAPGINQFMASALACQKRGSSDNAMVEGDRISSSNSTDSLVMKDFDSISIASNESSSSAIVVNGFEAGTEGAGTEGAGTEGAGALEAGTDSPVIAKWREKVKDGQRKIGFNSLSLEELRRLAKEIKEVCDCLSESLVKELKCKDELYREREERDRFIPLLLRISREQKSQEVLQANRRQRILFHVTSNAENCENKFLGVSIPYVPAEHGPSPETIRSLTAILQALLDEDPKVQGLVKDYTIKVMKELHENS